MLNEVGNQKLENTVEGMKRVKQIAEQLNEHQRYVTFIKRDYNSQSRINDNDDKKLKNRLDSLETDLLKLMDNIEDFRRRGNEGGGKKLSKSNKAVVKVKKQPATSEEHEEFSSLSPSSPDKPISSMSVQQAQTLQVNNNNKFFL